MDKDGNQRIMKPNWLFMKEAVGHSMHALANHWKTLYSSRDFDKNFQKGIFRPKMVNETFVVDFMICDDFHSRSDWTPRRLFIIQVHPNNTVKPKSFDRCYHKTSKTRSSY